MFFLQEDGAEIKRQVCQSCIAQALVDVYTANMISHDNHWQGCNSARRMIYVASAQTEKKRRLSANIEQEQRLSSGICTMVEKADCISAGEEARRRGPTRRRYDIFAQPDLIQKCATNCQEDRDQYKITPQLLLFIDDP